MTPSSDTASLATKRPDWIAITLCLVQFALPGVGSLDAQVSSSPAARVPEQAPAQTAETIDVSRIIIDAHVLDADAHLVTALAPEDLIVRVDGKEARVESVEWVDERPRHILETDEDGEETRTIEPAAGRLFVYYVQTEFARTWNSKERTLGEMELIREIRQYIDLLQPNDRVAILQFDSHLKLRLDFTSDHQQVDDAFAKVLLIDDPPRPPAVAAPSLASMLDRTQMREASSDEKALTLLAHALRKIEGAKNVILFGWGLGTVTSRIYLAPRVVRAAGELAAARATVYSFNFGIGNEMRFGLQEVAEDTGGFYAPVGDEGFKRLRALLQGHFEIEVRDPVPSIPGKLHRIEVRARQAGFQVQARSSFVDQ